MSKRAQEAVIACLRQPAPAGATRWSPPAIGKAHGLATQDVVSAIQSLRFAGKIRFERLELSASMLAESEQNSNRGGELAPIKSPAKPVALTDDVGPGGKQNVGTAGKTRQRGNCSPIGNGETAAQPVSDPAAGEPVAAAGSIPPGAPGHDDPAGHDTADDAGAVAATINAAPASSDGRPVHRNRSLLPEDAKWLVATIDCYLAQTGMAANLFGALALDPPFPGFVGLLRRRLTAREACAAQVRAFMARYPEGTTREAVREDRQAAARAAAEAMRGASIAAAPGLGADAGTMTIAEAVAAEAEAMGARREQARCTGTVANQLSPIVIAVQSQLLEEPEDAFAFLRRRWPQLQVDVFALAKLEEATPATMLARVIDAGVMCILADRAEAEA